MEHFLFVLVIQPHFLYFPLEFFVIFLESINISWKLIHIVIEWVVLLLRFNESICNLFKSIYATFLFDIIEGFFYHFHMLFILLNHFELFFIGSDDLLQSVFEQRLSINSLRFVTFLILKSFSISFIIHIVLLESIKLLQILVSLNFILWFNLDDLLFELLSSSLLFLNQIQFFLRFSLVTFDLLLQRGKHFDVIFLLSSQHVDIIF